MAGGGGRGGGGVFMGVTLTDTHTFEGSKNFIKNEESRMVGTNTLHFSASYLDLLSENLYSPLGSSPKI